MTIKPFAIQGADLTLGGVNLQAGTTGVVIPGVTRATNYKVEEVNDTDDQTFSNFPPDTEGEVVVVDYVQYQAIVADTGGSFADFTAMTDDEGYIDEIEVNGRGTYTSQQAADNAANDMYAYIGTSSANDRPLVPQDWIQIPFRPKMRAGAIELEGGGSSGGGVVERSVNYPLGESGDTKGTLALTPGGYTYICTRDFIEPQSETFTAWHTTANIGQTPPDSGYQAFTVDFSDPRNSDLYDFIVDLPLNFGGYPEFSFNDGDTWVTAHSYGGTYPGENSYAAYTFAGSALSDNYEVLVRLNTIQWNIWSQIDLGDLQVAGQWINTPKYQGGEGSVQLGHDNVDLWVENDDNSLAELWLHNEDTSAPHADIIVAAANDNDPTAGKKWMFQADGSLKFPDGTLQTTAYTGQTSSTGELYIMANADGNIVTSDNGIDWNDPQPSGMNGINRVEVHGGVIVYTAGGEMGPGTPGLYYSTTIGTTTLCAGTSIEPITSNNIYWNEVHYFSSTDKWVAVGFIQGDNDFPAVAHSDNGIAWTVVPADNTFVTGFNTGNNDWQLTDVTWLDETSQYIITSTLNGAYGGIFLTADITTALDGTNHVAIELNSKKVVPWSVTAYGGPPGYVTLISDEGPGGNTTWFGAGTSVGGYSIEDGWWSEPILDEIGYQPVVTEVAYKNGNFIAVTSDGQVISAMFTMGPTFVVSIPVPYTSTINDISRSDKTIDTFTTSPSINGTNSNWVTDYDDNPNINGDVFHVVITGGELITCDLITAGNLSHNVNDTITIPGGLFGGTNMVDDIVVTVTAINKALTTIRFTGDHGYNDGEKITISGVTSADASEPGRTEQSYNGTYYIKNNSSTYELYTDAALTIPWDTTSYWPVNLDTGTLTWSHGTYFDAAGVSNSYYYIGNDDEQIFRSSTGLTWTQQADFTGIFFNDFAYGSFGNGPSNNRIDYSDSETGYDSSVVLTYDFNVDVDNAHLNVNGNGTWELGSDNLHVKIGTTDLVADGQLDVNIRTPNAEWTFTRDGKLHFPDGTRQVTAYVHTNINMDGGGAAVHFEQEVGYIDGGFSATRHGVADPTFDGGNRLTVNNQYNLDGGGA